MTEKIIPNGRVIFILPYEEPEIFPHTSRSPLSFKLFLFLHLASVIDAAEDLSLSVFPFTEIHILMFYFGM